MNIARTTLSSKLLNVEKDHFARLAVDAVLRLKVCYSCNGNALLSFTHVSFTVLYRTHAYVRTHCITGERQLGLHPVDQEAGREPVRLLPRGRLRPQQELRDRPGTATAHITTSPM